MLSQPDNWLPWQSRDGCSGCLEFPFSFALRFSFVNASRFICNFICEYFLNTLASPRRRSWVTHSSARLSEGLLPRPFCCSPDIPRTVAHLGPRTSPTTPPTRQGSQFRESSPTAFEVDPSPTTQTVHRTGAESWRKQSGVTGAPPVRIRVGNHVRLTNPNGKLADCRIVLRRKETGGLEESRLWHPSALAWRGRPRDRGL